MKTVRITAKSVEEAIAQGLQELDATREQAVVRIIEEPSSGLFGLLRKKQAVVEVSVPEDAVNSISEEAARVVSEAFHRIDAIKKKEILPGEKIQGIEVTVGPEVSTEPDIEMEEIEEHVDTVVETEEQIPVRHKREEFAFSAEEQNETAEAARTFLMNVFHAMDIDITIEKMLSKEHILLTLHGERLGLLIGKRGQTLEALQYLTNLAAGKLYHHNYFVMLDIENYRERRRQTLENLAARCAAKAKRTGQPVRLEPMSAGERRIIHMALKEDRLISTDSEGETPYRYVVIKLK